MSISPGIELNEWEFRQVMAELWDIRLRYLDNVFCSCSGKPVSIVNFKIYLNNLNDLVLKGSCSNCGHKVGRYIETGEMGSCSLAAKRIRELKS